jgi:hypothetical protein
MAVAIPIRRGIAQTRQERPDAVHIHAFTRAVSLMLVGLPSNVGSPSSSRIIRRAVSPTWHVDAFGKEMCDGVLKVRRCTSCSLEGRGLPRWATVLSAICPFGMGVALKAN